MFFLKPLQLHFGNKDQLKGFSDPEAADALEKLLKENSREYEFYRYEAGHGFANQLNPNFDKDCTDLARNRVHVFFAKHLD